MCAQGLLLLLLLLQLLGLLIIGSPNLCHATLWHASSLCAHSLLLWLLWFILRPHSIHLSRSHALVTHTCLKYKSDV